MISSEKIIFKLLDHKNLRDGLLLDKIAKVLDLQYFFDEITKIHTLAGTNFVIDFQDGIFKLVFVNEKYFLSFKYVEHFLNESFSKGDRFSFYNFLKYFSFHDKPQEKKGKGVNTLCSTICDCIKTYNYCEITSFDDIVLKYSDTNLVYNIFSHREEFHFYEPFFISIPKIFMKNNVINGMQLNDLIFILKEGFNLSKLFDISNFNRTIYKFFLSFDPGFHYSVVFDSCEITIKNDWRLLNDGEYDKKKSFLFKKGFDIKKIMEFKM
ncbi:hypothetical protein NBO_84g0009 [Nosema bombycis CQ1]|uniref:Uncharacterized protein n=1 Tax=Nosema bombycis (strain CQ1 / CVCC 102059) TaxID=578461 RepID=R0KRC1_NOSB1|nr:hypothetical protein NBO_84g0009 [Nosema bombycis CQ1]|eukprot:EOB13291.1 hypothetical protein NBO_84g0009 [Nosema bombycis CQ1]